MAYLAGLACMAAAASTTGTVGVLAVFKNEAQGMTEWVKHHLAEGITQFVLIDDNSTDGGDELARELGCIVRPVKYPGNQSANFYEYAHLLQTEWQAVIDLDEYIYAPDKGSSVAQYLRSVEQTAPDCGTIVLPWRFFPPAYTDRHPVSVIASSVHTEPFGHSTQVKTLARRSHLCESTSFDMHRATVRTRQCVSTSPPTRRNETSCASPVTEYDGRIFDHPEKATWGPLALPDQQIALNHYNIGSWEFYCRIKMTRGDVDGKNNFRDYGYFWQGQRCMPYFSPDNECGCNTVDDRLLAKRGGSSDGFFADLPLERRWPTHSVPPLLDECMGKGPINPNVTQANLVPFGHCPSGTGTDGEPQPLTTKMEASEILVGVPTRSIDGSSGSRADRPRHLAANEAVPALVPPEIAAHCC